MDPLPLLALPEIGIGTKKGALVLLACDLYRKIGLRPGSDNNVINFCGSIIISICEIDLEVKVLKSVIEEVTLDIPVDPGVFAN